MKTLLVIVALLLLSVSSALAEPPYGGISLGAFYSSLDPYGEWISVDAGVFAWRPVNVMEGWRPYYNGRWLWTDDGWYWTSDEPWAWATYHYGRWYYDDYYGWLWIPGYDWAPAWVEWRYGGDCIGWAPLGPYALFSISFGVFYRTSWVTPYNYWAFTDYRYMCSPDLHRYVYRTDMNTRYIGRTRSGGSVRYDGGRTVSRGPDREYVERRGNVRVDRTEIVHGTERPGEHYVRDGDRGRVEVYRPPDDRSATNVGRPARVRESERRVALDVQNLDVHSRTVERQEGRDLRRAEQYRQRQQLDVQRRDSERSYQPQPRVERKNPEALPGKTRREPERAVEQPRPSPRSDQRNARQPQYTPPKVERQAGREPRRETIQRPAEPPRRESYQRPSQSTRQESLGRSSAPSPRPTPSTREGRRGR